MTKYNEQNFQYWEYKVVVRLIELVRYCRDASPEGGGVDPRYFRYIWVNDLSWKSAARPVVRFGYYLPSKILK